MSKRRSIPPSPDDFAQVFSSLLTFALAAFFVVPVTYFYWFRHGAISNRTEDWAEFGEYIGGTLGGILGLLSFIGVVSTVVLMRNQLLFAKSQSNRDELQRLVASASASIDALLQREFDDVQLPTTLNSRRPNQTQTLAQLIEVGARAATAADSTNVEDYLVSTKTKQRAQQAKEFLAAHADGLISEMDHMSQALHAYEHAEGSAEVVQIYVTRTSRYARYLSALGFTLPDNVAHRFILVPNPFHHGGRPGGNMNTPQVCVHQALKAKVLIVLADESAFRALPTGEQVLVALILDRPDLFPRDYTMLDAFNRIGPELAEAAMRVQRAGLHCEELAHG